MDKIENFAYICVITNHSYYPGLCALAHSLRETQMKYPLKVVVPESSAEELRDSIARIGLEMIVLPDLKLPEELQKLNPNLRWNQTFFKLQIFKLMQYQKIVFLDLDMLILKNIDDLFECPHMSAVAAGQCVYSDWTGLNSGIMVIEPNEEVYDDLINCLGDACKNKLETGRGFGDQDVVNYYYRNWWEHKELVLPEIYNCLTYCIDEVYKVIGRKNVRVIHFAEDRKPWNFTGPRMYLHILGSFVRGKYYRADLCYRYWKCVKKSCPEYLKYTWH